MTTKVVARSGKDVARMNARWPRISANFRSTTTRQVDAKCSMSNVQPSTGKSKGYWAEQ